MSRGKLISFEGIDGAGKSTQISLLREYMRNTDTSFRVYREPGGSYLSERIRSLLLDRDDEIDVVTETLLFSAARSNLIYTEVIPQLNTGAMVVLDRFYDSTFAYQGFVKGMNTNEIEELTKIATQGIQPDKTIYLHITPEESLKRREGTRMDRMEKSTADRIHTLYDAYETLAQKYPSRIVKIDGSGPTAEIHTGVVNVIEQLYK